MPELPEVETVRRGLAAHLPGRRILSVQLNRPDLRVPFPDGLGQALTGARVQSVDRRAKYLLLHLDNAKAVIAHLGMSGQLLLMPQEAYRPRPHDHLRIDLEGADCLIFHDPRRFGLIALAESGALATHKLLRHLGPEPLEAAFSADYLGSALARRSGALKTALMDQALVVGVGNIYACEALFRCRLSPFMPARSAAKRVPALISAIREVLAAAIDSGGSTLRDYVRSSGDSGYFQHHFRVYGREGEPCEVCATPIARAVQAGRSTFYCISCQKVK